MANNQMINFNTQDVANTYRRNQYAQALQERMNAPTPVHTYQGFQAPTSPAAGIAKALDIYSVWQNEKNQEDRYQAEKAAAEQKAQNIINTQESEAKTFGNQFNPVLTEKMIGGNTSFTPTQYADAINAYGKPQEPTQASDMLNGEPTTYGRDEGTLKTTSTPRTREEIMRFESEGVGSNNPQINRIAENSRQSRVADETAQAVKDAATLDRGKGIEINGQLVNPYSAVRMGEQIPEQQKSPTSVVNVNTGLVKNLSEEVAKRLGDLTTKADESIGQLNSVNSILKATDENKIFSGFGGGLGLGMAQFADMIGIGGKDNAEKILNTRSVIQGLAQMTLVGRKEMKGQGAVNESEGLLAERATSGKIEDLTAKEIQQLARVAERVARYNLNKHKTMLDKVKKLPNAGELGSTFEIGTEPDSYVMIKNRLPVKTSSGANVSNWNKP